MIDNTQKMAAVETMTAPALPITPEGDIFLRDIAEALQESVVQDIQQVSGQNPETAAAIHEPESAGLSKETPETVQTIPEKKPESLSEQLREATSVPKSIAPSQEDLSCIGKVSFDPSKHLQFTYPSNIWTMKELDYPETQGVSPVGVSEPFPLFSAEAVKQMRTEILSDNVWQKYKFSSNLSDCMLRGYAPE